MRTICLILLVSSLASPVGAKSSASAQEKTLQTLISSVRYSKDAMALKELNGVAQGKILLGEAWSQGSEAEQKEFIELFHGLFATMAFPKIRANFEKLETILYETPEISDKNAKVKSTLVLLHPLKKQEIKVTYDLSQEGGAWKVVDVTVQGDKSMLTNIRDDQVQPIVKGGGWKNLLKIMRQKLEQVKKS